MTSARQICLALSLAVASAFPISVAAVSWASAATAEDLSRDSDHALQSLYRSHPFAQDIAKHAKAILVFPNIVKAGLVFGGAYGEGELKRGSQLDGYYNSVTASWAFRLAPSPTATLYS